MEEELEQRVEQLIEEKTGDEEVDREQLKQEIIEELDSKSEEEKKSLVEKVSKGNVSRRDFLKTLGLGAGGLALSSSVAAPWSLWRPENKGPSGIDADTVDGKESDQLGGVPSGVIMAWSGTTSDIPAGWVLCDGNNSTPDLRNRFVTGAGSSYSAGNTGGASTVQLSESELAIHTHQIPETSVTGGSETALTSGDTTDPYDSGSAGGDQAHENRPPYHALAYIMKT